MHLHKCRRLFQLATLVGCILFALSLTGSGVSASLATAANTTTSKNVTAKVDSSSSSNSKQQIRQHEPPSPAQSKPTLAPNSIADAVNRSSNHSSAAIAASAAAATSALSGSSASASATKRDGPLAQTNKWRQINNASGSGARLHATPQKPLLVSKAAAANAANANNQSAAIAKSAGDINNKMRLISKYRLPSWFQFNAFKQLYGKKYPSARLNELHRRIYLRTSLKVFEQRALYRSGRLDSLSSVNELSDLTTEELDEFRAPKSPGNSSNSSSSSSKGKAARKALQLPECCTYDQVYTKIIELLSSATNSHDLSLSRALVDELEQKPLVDTSGSTDQDLPQKQAYHATDSQGQSVAAAAASAVSTSNGNDEQALESTQPSNVVIERISDVDADDERQYLKAGGAGEAARAMTMPITPMTSNIDDNRREWPQAPALAEGDKMIERQRPPPSMQHRAYDKELQRRRAQQLSSSSSNKERRREDDSMSLVQTSGGDLASGRNRKGAVSSEQQRLAFEAAVAAAHRSNLAQLAPLDHRARNRGHALPATISSGGGGGELGRSRMGAIKGEQATGGSGGGLKDSLFDRSGQTMMTTSGGDGESVQLALNGRGHKNNNNRQQQQQQLLLSSGPITTPTTTTRQLNGEHASTATIATTGAAAAAAVDDDDDGSNGRVSGAADDEDVYENGGVPPEIEEAVRAQVAEQLSANSPLGRELSKQLSAYFGEPVELATSRATTVARAPPTVAVSGTAAAAAAAANKLVKGDDKQQQQLTLPPTPKNGR